MTNPLKARKILRVSEIFRVTAILSKFKKNVFQGKLLDDKKNNGIFYLHLDAYGA